MQRLVPAAPRLATFYFLLMGLIWFAPACSTADDPLKTLAVSERLLILQHAPWAENMAVIDAGPSLVVVDTFSAPDWARQGRAAAEKHFKKKVSHVINTHHHFDHTFGNQVFADALIVGQRHCPEDMRADYGGPEPHQPFLRHSRSEQDPAMRRFYRRVAAGVQRGFRLTPPIRLVDERDTLQVGDLTIELFHVPGLHTRSNLTIWIPQLGLIFTRRDFQAGSIPALESGIDLNQLTASLSVILSSSRPVKFLVAGHGDPFPDPDLRPALDYLRVLAGVVAEGKHNGALVDEKLLAARFASFPGSVANPEIHRKNLELLWREWQPGWKPME